MSGVAYRRPTAALQKMVAAPASRAKIRWADAETGGRNGGVGPDVPHCLLCV